MNRQRKLEDSDDSAWPFALVLGDIRRSILRCSRQSKHFSISPRSCFFGLSVLLSAQYWPSIGKSSMWAQFGGPSLPWLRQSWPASFIAFVSSPPLPALR